MSLKDKRCVPCEGGTPPLDELTTRTRDGLANGGGGFRIAADDEGGSLIVLEHPVIGRASAEIRQDSGVTVLELLGSLS